MGSELARETHAVRLQPVGSAGKEVERRPGRELRREEGLEHPVAGDRVDEAGGVADDRRATARKRRARRAKREPVASDILQVGRRHAVRGAERAQIFAQARSLSLPAPEPDVRVVALGKDPPVAAGHDAELEHGPSAVASPSRS